LVFYIPTEYNFNSDTALFPAPNSLSWDDPKKRLNGLGKQKAEAINVSIFWDIAILM
jgi:hypothetical protein